MSIKKHIPNTITCCNLISGCIATSFAFGGNPEKALLWIIIGAVLTFRWYERPLAARFIAYRQGAGLACRRCDLWRGTRHHRILTTLCNGVSGVSGAFAPWLPYVAFIIAAFSALRLAKFNLDERQTTSFIGVPTPANALFWGSLVVSSPSWITNQSWSIYLVLALISSPASCWYASCRCSP